MEGHLLNDISQRMAVTVELLNSVVCSCGMNFVVLYHVLWCLSHFQEKCCMTVMWHVGGAGHNVKKMHWAGKNEKGEGPAGTGLVGVMSTRAWN